MCLRILTLLMICVVPLLFLTTATASRQEASVYLKLKEVSILQGEELPAFAIVIIPLFIRAGYDALTGIQVILIGAVCGNMADVVNPYAVGAAVAAIGNDELSLGSGILLRLVLLVVLLAIGIFSVTRYASMVKKDPNKSALSGIEGVNTQITSESSDAQASEETVMTGRQKASLVAFGIVILACVLGYVPWDSIPVGNQTMFEYVNILQTKLSGTFLGNLVGTDNFTPFGWWYFDEFSVAWLLGAVAIGLINRMNLHDWVSTFIEGCKDLMGVVLVLSAARGISIFMGSKESGMSITFIHWIQSVLSGVPLWAFAIAAVLVYVCIALHCSCSLQAVFPASLCQSLVRWHLRCLQAQRRVLPVVRLS